MINDPKPMAAYERCQGQLSEVDRSKEARNPIPQKVAKPKAKMNETAEAAPPRRDRANEMIQVRASTATTTRSVKVMEESNHGFENFLNR